MPFVPGFSNDVFISFSHRDNSRGWVKGFQDQLRDRLAQLGAAVTIWRDPKLGGADVFSEKIFIQLQQSALFLPVVSLSWNESPWCQDELRAFERFAALNGGFHFDQQLRLVKVVKDPLDDNKHRALFGVRGFEFFKWEAQSEDFDGFHQSSPEFEKNINKLAQDMKRLLNTFSEHVKNASQKDIVYVATTTFDLKANRDLIVQELEARNYTVTPPDCEPLHRLAAFQAVAKAELAASMMSIHLVSDQHNSIIEGGHDSITEQYKVAQSLSKDRIVWVKPKHKLYSEFDNAVKNGLPNRIEILTDRSIEHLKEVIRDKLDQREDRPAHSRKSETGVGLFLNSNPTERPSENLARRQQALTVFKNTNPFRGLRSFEREQAHLFFGRDEQIKELIERLGQHRFLPIAGVSGSGKSSLVQAGLIPALTGSYVATEASPWHIVRLRPGRNPIPNLATRLCREFGISEFDSVLQTLRGSSAGLARIVRQHLGSAEYLLVLVDQFEELFRYHKPAALTSETDEDIAFVKLLLAAAGESRNPLPGFDDLPVYVVTTMRSEYLGQCSRFRGLPEVLNDNQYLIPRLTREQQRHVIEGPINLMGASIEQALVQQLLNELGDDPAQLPALQHALMRTWEHSVHGPAQGKLITRADYEAVGGKAEVLNRDADRIYEQLSDNYITAAITRRLFQRLVQSATTGNETRSLTSWSQLLAVTAADECDLKRVIEAFQERGLLTVSRDHDPIIDITHEILIGGWRRLTQWIEEEARSAVILRRLADQAANYAKQETSLLIDPQLQLTLNWRDETKPNEAWASRYDSRFAQAMKFLEQSRKEHEKQRRSELKRAASVAVALATSLFLALFGLLVAKFQNEAALAESDRSSHLLYDSNIFFASNAMASSQFPLARQRLDELLDPKLRDLRGFEWFYLWRAVHADQWDTTMLKEMATLAGHNGPVSTVAFSSAGTTLVSGSYDGTVKFWDTVQSKETTTLTAHSASVNSVAFSPDGNTLASCSDDKTVKLWDVATGTEVATFSGHSGSVNSVAFSPDGKTLASASKDRTVKLWDTAQHKNIATLSGHPDSVNSVVFSPNGKTLASCSANTLKLWDTLTRKELTTISGHSDIIYSVAFSPNGRTLASASFDNTVKLWELPNFNDNLWNTPTFRQLATLSGHSQAVKSVKFSPDGKTLASASDDGTVKLWDTSTGKELITLSGHSGFVWSVAFSADGKILASSSFDSTVKLWFAATKNEVVERGRRGY